jgi:molecular chaperone GrpE (heat shock protein)
MSQDETSSLLVFKEEPSAVSSQATAAEPVSNSQVNSDSASESHAKPESTSEDPAKSEPRTQEQEDQPQPMQEQQQTLKQDMREEVAEAKAEVCSFFYVKLLISFIYIRLEFVLRILRC